jgi:uncharacterized protein (TIGR02145 family)
MRYTLLLGSLLFLAGLLPAQDKRGTTFSGNTATDPGPCATAASNFMTEQDVNRLVTDMLDRINIRNRFIIVSCTKVENCQATLYKGKPYILYNPDFLQEVKRLNFSSADIQVSTRNWEALSILAHELGHHVNNHLLNPLPDATQRDMELEADEFVGSMIFLMGGTRDQAMAAFRVLPDAGTYTHPGRQQRLDAVARGWDKVKARTPDPKPDPKPDPVKPTPKSDPGKSDPKPDPGWLYPVTPKRANFASVSIGSQEWMGENLNVDRFRNGDPIPEAKTAEEWKEAFKNKQPAWSHYQNDTANWKVNGKLYNAYAVNDPRGLAPAGWHIPSNEEWYRLTAALGGQALAGKKMKSGNGWFSNGNGNNESRFSGHPGGHRDADGTFNNLGTTGYWWSAPASASNSWGRTLQKDSDLIFPFTGDFFIGFGFSVRCLRD